MQPVQEDVYTAVRTSPRIFGDIGSINIENKYQSDIVKNKNVDL
jgi:hypothetical protein